MKMMKWKKIAKRYMYYCPQCQNLSFSGQHCEKCGSEKMLQTPKRYGLTNLACISMSVMDFEAMKENFIQAQKYQIG